MVTQYITQKTIGGHEPYEKSGWKQVLRYGKQFQLSSIGIWRVSGPVVNSRHV